MGLIIGDLASSIVALLRVLPGAQNADTRIKLY